MVTIHATRWPLQRRVQQSSQEQAIGFGSRVVEHGSRSGLQHLQVVLVRRFGRSDGCEGAALHEGRVRVAGEVLELLWAAACKMRVIKQQMMLQHAAPQQSCSTNLT
jgi:hypothetical protein